MSSVSRDTLGLELEVSLHTDWLICTELDASIKFFLEGGGRSRVNRNVDELETRRIQCFFSVFNVILA